MPARRYKPSYNYRIKLEWKNDHIDDGMGWALNKEEATKMFNSMLCKINREKIKVGMFYFKDQLIKKI